MKLLDVGGGSHELPMPDAYKDYERVILDVRGGDICCNAVDMKWYIPASSFDVVYCSHTLEHFEPWDVPLVIENFAHVLKPGGFAEIRVPDIGELGHRLFAGDLDDVVYTSSTGVRVTISHLIWGYGPEIRGIGEEFRHRWGYSARTLSALLLPKFSYVFLGHEASNCELRALAYKEKPSVTVYGQEVA